MSFDYRRQDGRISALEPLSGRSGWLRLTRLTVTALEPQDFLFLTGLLDGGQELDPWQEMDEDLCRKLLTLPAATKRVPPRPPSALDEIANRRKQAILAEIDRRNGLLFEAEIDKLERWSDDLKLSLEREVKGIEKELREVKRESRFATDLASRLAAERRKRDLESRKSQKLKELFDARADIDKQHDELVTRLEAELQGQQTVQDLWTVHWSLE